MKKTLSTRQKWVRNAAIVFFTLLLLLTFFSNTIMNHSLAEVATVSVTSESVSTKVRGTGTVEAGEQTDVKLSESREIAEVLVEDGDTVKAGDVLFRLTEGDSTELTEAKQELTSLQEAYKHQILVEEIDPAIVTKAETGGVDYESATARLKTLKDAVDNAQAASDSIQKQTQAMDNGLTDFDTQVTQANADLDAANKQLAEAESAFGAYGLDESTIMAVLNGTADEEMMIDYATAQNAKAALDAYKQAQALVDQCTTAATDAANAQTAERNRLAQTASSAQETLDAATKAHEEYLSEINKIDELQTQYKAICEKQTAYDKLAASAVGTEVPAAVDGRISGVNVKKGDTTSPDLTLCSILSSKSGYTLRFSVTKQQAAKVKTGDQATIANSWYYPDLTATLRSIKNDPQDPGRSKVLVFDIQGDAEIGQSMTLSVGEKNATYDFVVPNSAVREDNNGKFILIIKEKNSPLGNRYVATRVDVDILASDDSKTAVTGALEGYEYVITTSTKLVSPGDYVRLAETAEQ